MKLIRIFILLCFTQLSFSEGKVMFGPGKASKRHLEGVHPDLIKVVMLAYKISEVDFSVVDGLRDLFTQRKYVKTGVSQTMDSKHLAQDDGFSHAVDLYPWVNNKTDHEERYQFMVCKAMHEAANRLGVHITIGCFWVSFEDKGQFGDRPHFELFRN